MLARGPWPDKCIQDPHPILLSPLIYSYCKRSISLNEVQCITTLPWWPASCVLSKSVPATLLFMRSFSHVFSWKLCCLLATFGIDSSERISVHLQGDRLMCPVSLLPCSHRLQGSMLESGDTGALFAFCLARMFRCPGSLILYLIFQQLSTSTLWIVSEWGHILVLKT